MQKKFPGVYRLLVIGSRVLPLLAYALIFDLSGAAYAASVTLGWDPHTDPNIVGYNIYRSSERGSFTSAPLNGELPLLTTTFTDSTVEAGTYYYVVKAVDVFGKETDASNQVEASVNSSSSSHPIVFTVLSMATVKPLENKLDIIDSTGAPLSKLDESQMRFGYARAPGGPGEAPNNIALITNSIGTSIVSESALAASGQIRAGRLYVNVDGSVNTGLAIVNDEMTSAVISFYFTDANGADFGHRSFTLEAAHSIASFVNQAPFNLPMSMQGTLTFQSSLPVTVTGFRGLTNQRGEFLMTTQPVSSLDSPIAQTPIIFPQFVDGSDWSTQIILVNPIDAPIAGTLQFFGTTAGAPVSALTMNVNGVTDSSFDYIIRPHGMVRFVAASAVGDVHVGYVLATPKSDSASPQGLSIFTLSNQGITVSETSAPAATPGTAFEMYVEKSPRLRSVLALANPSASPASTTFELAPFIGASERIVTSLVIPAGGYVAGFVDDLFPTMTDGFQGVLRTLSTQSIGVGDLRTRRNERGDTIVASLPVADQTSPTVSSTLVFPLVVNGGGFSTEFIGRVE